MPRPEVQTVELALLPTEQFDPDAESVRRFAAQLSRTRRVGLWRRSSPPVRIRVRSVGEGLCLMSMTVPEDAVRSLRAAVYHQVELRPVHEALSLFAPDEVPSAVAEGNGLAFGQQSQPPSAADAARSAPRTPPPPPPSPPAPPSSPPSPPSAGAPASAGVAGSGGAPSGGGATGSPIGEAVPETIPWGFPTSPPAAEDPHPPETDPPEAATPTTAEPEPDDGPASVARSEMVLANDAIWPLHPVPLRPDPLTPLALAMSDLHPDESLDIVIDLMPVTAAARRRWERKSVAKWERKDRNSSEQSIRDQFKTELLRGSPWERKANQQPAAEGKMRRRASEDRLTIAWNQISSAEPQFLAQVLVRASSPAEGRPAQIMTSALSSFDVYAGQHNWWRVRSWRLFGIPRGADSSKRRRRDFDERFAGGISKRRRLNRVGASAVAGFLKPPTAYCAAPNLARSDGILADPPAALPRWRPGARLWPLGLVRSRRDQEFMGAVPLDDSYFTLSCGRSGFGKTESAMGRIIATADAGHGIVFIDPHGTGIERIKHFLGPYRERVYEISLELGRPTQTAWNPLAIHHIDQLEERMISVTDSLAAAVGWRHGTNNRAIGITLGSVRTLLEMSLVLPDGLKPTVFQLATLLGDEEWRETVIAGLSAQTREYWGRFAYKAGEFTPLVSLVDRLRTSRSVAALLGASEPTFHLRKAMDRGGIILVRLRGTGDMDKLVAALMVYSVLEALLSRRDIPEDRRRPVHVWIDEAQVVDEAVRKMTAALAEQARKFGGRLHLMCQAPQRLSSLTLTAMMTNRSHLITSAVSEKGAKLFASEWGGQVTASTLVRLRKFGFVGQTQLNGQTTEPFRIGSVPLEALWPDHYGDPATDAILDKYIAANTGYLPVVETLDALDTLTEQIRAHFADRQPIAETIAAYDPMNVRKPYG